MPNAFTYISPERASPTKAAWAGSQKQTTETGHAHDNKKAKWKFPPQRELWLLLALRGAGPEGAYGLAIKSKIEESSGGSETFSVGSLYTLLKRLRNKGYVDSYEGDSPGGGGTRQYYHLTEKGFETLRRVDDFLHCLQSGDFKI
ncbi:MAG: PadR family transcriptional regulator [Cyanobacteria bacterium J06650_10]